MSSIVCILIVFLELLFFLFDFLSYFDFSDKVWLYILGRPSTCVLLPQSPRFGIVDIGHSVASFEHSDGHVFRLLAEGHRLYWLAFSSPCLKYSCTAFWIWYYRYQCNSQSSFIFRVSWADPRFQEECLWVLVSAIFNSALLTFMSGTFLGCVHNSRLNCCHSELWKLHCFAFSTWFYWGEFDVR